MPPVQKTRHRIDPDAIPSPVSASCLSAVLCCYTESRFLWGFFTHGDANDSVYEQYLFIRDLFCLMEVSGLVPNFLQNIFCFPLRRKVIHVRNDMRGVYDDRIFGWAVPLSHNFFYSR